MIRFAGHFQTQFNKFFHVTLGEMKKQSDKNASGNGIILEGLKSSLLKIQQKIFRPAVGC